jgi:hypothetical protein
MITITKDCVVALRYIMKNSKGDVLENTMNNTPVCYLQGASGIHPLLQMQLEGLKAGDQKSVYLAQEAASTNDDFSFEVIIDDVRAAFPEEVRLGYPVSQNSNPCEPDCMCYSNPVS